MTSPCPICQRPAATRETNKASPFCSPRCKLVDLGRWLEEAYRVPDADAEDDERPASTRSPTQEKA
ncbi:MAG TPA: DNA gyrase inhibitor YacG [Polyangiaceae bacterium]|nr:DNA gyrase inhibitor YacG [Polyangiaceae bacterium]